jgi:hypothetical protein
MYELVIQMIKSFNPIDLFTRAQRAPTVHARKDCAPIDSPALEIGLPGHDVGTTHVCD